VDVNALEGALEAREALLAGPPARREPPPPLGPVPA